MNQIRQLINRISMIFPDPVIEKEFRMIQKKNTMDDFQATIIVIVLVTVTTSIERLVKWDRDEFLISMVTNAILIAVFCLRKLFKKNIELLTLAVLVVYNAYRIIYLYFSFSKLGKISMHNSGYNFAVLLMILIYNVPNIHFKILAVIGLFVYRFLLIWILIDRNSAMPASIIRSIFVDAFIVYFYYTQERKQRAVFQHYSENREELLKFKDMLADFPQSITVVDNDIKKSLFVNKTFTNVFQGQIVESQSHIHLDTLLTQPPVSQEISKPRFNMLRVDQTSLKEIESLRGNREPIEASNNITNLKTVMEVLISENLLKDRSLTITAHAKWQGQTKAFQVILKKVKWDRIDAVAVILNDITDQQNIITLKISNANKDKFLATVSHEFRTPLHGIIGLLEISEKQNKKTGIMKYLSLCKDNAYLLLGLVNSMLAFHQSTTGKLRVKPEKINIRQHLENVVKLFQFQVQQKRIYLELFIAKEVPEYVITDIERLKEIVIQLLGNAIKFTSEGGVRLEVVEDLEDEKSLRFLVIDTGKGIKQEDQKNLFQLNSKNVNGESVNNKGVGLGLTISNTLALILSGEITGQGIKVQSKYNHGSVFSFKILKELTVQAGAAASARLRRLRSSGDDRNSFHLDDDSDDKIGTDEMSPNRRESRKFDYQDFDDVSEKPIKKEQYEELLSPANLESKLSTYVSRQKINLGDLKLSSRGLKSSSPVLNAIQENGDIQEKENGSPKKDVKDDSSEELKLKRKAVSSEPELIIDGSILVVDDNPFNLLIAWNLIKDLGFPVKTAMGGREAIETVKNCFKEGTNLKLILMDCQMPILDGYETTKVLRKMMDEGEVQTVPILAWTANDSQEDVIRCYECGMVGHITKPTTKEGLIKAFSQVYT